MISRSAARPIVIAGFWVLFGAISGLQIQLSMLSHHHSWPRVIGYQVVVWGLWIAISFAIGWLLRAVPLNPMRPGNVLLHGVFAIGFGLLHLAAWVALELVLVPYDVMNPTHFVPRLRSLMLYQMPAEVVLYVLVAIAHVAAESSRLEREQERRAVQLEASLARARLLALELQTQPHFLFNTLNGISSLVRAGQNPQALSMISGLSDLLRYALDRRGGETVALEEEARTVERYLEIQRLRFADRLVVEVALDPATRRAAVPALLLQPLVENAIRHGISRTEAPGRITMRSSRHGDTLIIEIGNTGRLDPNRRNGIGLSTTLARLTEHYADRGRLDLVEQNGGVLARLSIPFSEVA